MRNCPAWASWAPGSQRTQLGIKDRAHKVGVNKEFQCAVDGRRRRAVSIPGEQLEDIVGPHRLVARPDQLKNSAALSRESQSSLATDIHSILQSFLDTEVVIVFRTGNRVSGAASLIGSL